MFETIIRSGPTEIVSSGTVIAYFNQPIVINVKLEDFTLELIFKFEDNKSNNNNQPVLTPTIVEHNKLELTLHNFSSSVGAGNKETLGIGSSLGRQLSLSYRVYDLGGSDKTLHYTLYRRMKGDA